MADTQVEQPVQPAEAPPAEAPQAVADQAPPVALDQAVQSPKAPSNAAELTSSKYASTEQVKPMSFKELNQEFKKFLYENPSPKLAGVFEKLEQKTGAKREHAAYGFLALLGLYLVFGRSAELVANFIGFGYPVFASVKAIRTEDKSDDTLWLTYWTVFGFFCVLDFWVESIMHVFPVYLILKSMFFLYLSLPQTRGAQQLYAKVVDPAISRLEARFGGAKKE